MAIKLRRNVKNAATFVVGTADIARGTVVVLNSGVVDASGAGAAKAVGITDEIGYANKEVRVAQDGDTVLALASDGSISEGDWLVSDGDGKVDTAAAATTGAQNIVGRALRASSEEDQRIPVVVGIKYWPKAAS